MNTNSVYPTTPNPDLTDSPENADPYGFPPGDPVVQGSALKTLDAEPLIDRIGFLIIKKALGAHAAMHANAAERDSDQGFSVSCNAPMRAAASRHSVSSCATSCAAPNASSRLRPSGAPWPDHNDR